MSEQEKSLKILSLERKELLHLRPQAERPRKSRRTNQRCAEGVLQPNCGKASAIASCPSGTIMAQSRLRRCRRQHRCTPRPIWTIRRCKSQGHRKHNQPPTDQTSYKLSNSHKCWITLSMASAVSKYRSRASNRNWKLSRLASPLPRTLRIKSPCSKSSWPLWTAPKNN